MHFTWNITAGQLSILLAILGLFLRINHVAVLVAMLTVEHEMMMEDYAKRHKTTVEAIATRKALKRPKIFGFL